MLSIVIGQVRELMAQMGFRTFQEVIGRTDKLKFEPDTSNPKAQLLDFSNILANALELRPGVNIVRNSTPQEFKLEERLVSDGQEAIPCITFPITVLK